MLAGLDRHDLAQMAVGLGLRSAAVERRVAQDHARPSAARMPSCAAISQASSIVSSTEITTGFSAKMCGTSRFAARAAGGRGAGGWASRSSAGRSGAPPASRPDRRSAAGSAPSSVSCRIRASDGSATATIRTSGLPPWRNARARWASRAPRPMTPIRMRRPSCHRQPQSRDRCRVGLAAGRGCRSARPAPRRPPPSRRRGARRTPVASSAGALSGVTPPPAMISIRPRGLRATIAAIAAAPSGALAAPPGGEDAA